MTPRAALAVLLAEVTEAAIAGHVARVTCAPDADAHMAEDAALVVVGLVIKVDAWIATGSVGAVEVWDQLRPWPWRDVLAPWRARLVALLAEPAVEPPTPEDMATSYWPGRDVRDARPHYVAGIRAERARVTRAVERPVNRFLRVCPEAVPWRKRATVDTLAYVLASGQATDAEAADMFAEAADRLRADLVRAVNLNGTPVRIVIDAASAKAAGLTRG